MEKDLWVYLLVHRNVGKGKMDLCIVFATRGKLAGAKKTKESRATSHLKHYMLVVTVVDERM